MKKSIFSICMLLLGAFVVVAQGQDDKRQDRRTKFITKQLDLTTDQAAALLPILENMGDEIKSAHESLNLKEDRGNLESISDAEATERMDKLFTLERQKLDIKKKYSSQIRDVVGPKKTLRFFHMFREFESQRRGGGMRGQEMRGKRDQKQERKRERKQKKRLERK